jgi:hypothetical protein
MVTSVLNCKIGEVLEISIFLKLTTAQSAVPDRTSTFLSVSSYHSSSKEESTIWDARVDMNTAPVGTEGEFLKILPVCRLRILPD